MIRILIPMNWLVIVTDPDNYRFRIKDVLIPDMPKEMRDSFGVEIDDPILYMRYDGDHFEHVSEAYLTFWDEEVAALFKLTYL